MNASVSPWSRRLILALALLSLGVAWSCMTNLAGTVPWYRHTEANFPALTDSLALNSGIAPARAGERGLLPSYVLALDWRIRHHLGLLPAWNIPTLAQTPEPLPAIRELVRLERIHSRLLVILMLLGGGVLACAILPGLESGCFTLALLAGGAGLLYHGLVVQPELLGVGLGGVLALLCAWRGTTASRWWSHHFGVFLAGLCGGFAALAQSSGFFHLLVVYAWCWLAALTRPGVRPGPSGIRVGLLPTASAMLLLWLAHEAAVLGATTAVTAERLRAVALLAGLLPLLALWEGPGRIGGFLRERASELALLCGGALASLALGYGALRAILPAEAALACWAGQLEILFYPGPFLENLLTAPPGIAREVARFIRENPFLFAAAAALTLVACVDRGVPVRTKAFIGLLLAGTLGHLWQLAHVRYVDSASVAVQVPLLLLCSLALLALGPWPHRADRHAWMAPLILVASLVLLATVPWRLRVKSPQATAEDNPAVSGHTVTHLFDHHAHPPAFRQMMRHHYGDRTGFAQALGQYLADPAHRH